MTSAFPIFSAAPRKTKAAQVPSSQHPTGSEQERTEEQRTEAGPTTG